ncbi:MAG: hypothetical protein KF878_23045 [Planctomycetes bacterium]|nr:hypothetical protein [Planctomycetota bacterium]
MLHRQLLEQARHLARRERGRPRQASLRRAVSTAYYALFHLLAHEVSRQLLRGQRGAGLRPLLGRALAHSDMKAASRSFAGGTLPAVVQDFAASQPSPELRRVAKAFVLLQEQRHAADYDLRRRFGRREALTIVSEAEAAFRAWAAARGRAEALLFLVCLLTWKPLMGRS